MMHHDPIDPGACGTAAARRGVRLVGDRMSAPAITIAWDAPVTAAWRLMRERNLQRLPVVDHHGQLMGTIRETDLADVARKGTISTRFTPLASTTRGPFVGEVMIWDTTAIAPDADIVEAARLMYDRKLRALPVVDAQRVIGILTETDLLEAFLALLMAREPGEDARWQP